MAGREIIFSDIDLKFKPHPITGALNLLTNDDAVKQSVKNLVLTNRNERLMQPTVFSDVTAMLFENMNALTQTQIQTRVEDVLANEEPRANIVDVDVQVDPDYNQISVTVAFIPLNRKEPIRVTVFLEKVR